jgi:hypothetical protein
LNMLCYPQEDYKDNLGNILMNIMRLLRGRRRRCRKEIGTATTPRNP